MTVDVIFRHDVSISEEVSVISFIVHITEYYTVGKQRDTILRIITTIGQQYGLSWVEALPHWRDGR